MQTVANHQQDNFKILANCSFWEQFHSDFEKHASHIDVLSAWVQPAMLTLYSQIYNKSKYQHAIERAKNQIIKNNNLVIPLFNEDFLRVNLISIKAGSSLPLHDHPGSSGSMMVISGDARIIVCEQEKLSINKNQSRCKLSIVENKIITTGETSCFTQEQHNIHSVEAVTDRVVIMVIHTSPFAANQQTYFFTANPRQKVGSQVLAQCIRVQAFQKFHQNHHNLKGVVNET